MDGKDGFYGVSDEENIAASEDTVAEVTDVSIISIYPGKVVWCSPETGRDYVFQAGTAVNVDKRDAEVLLAVKSNKGCCGGSDPIAMFILEN